VAVRPACGTRHSVGVVDDEMPVSLHLHRARPLGVEDRAPVPQRVLLPLGRRPGEFGRQLRAIVGVWATGILLLTGTALAQERQAITAPAPVLVRTATYAAGFTEPSRDRADSLEDLLRAFDRIAAVALARNEDDAVIVVDVLGRETRRELNGLTALTGRAQNKSWLTVRLTAGDFTTEFSGNGGSTGMLTGCAAAAGNVAEQIERWILDHRDRLREVQAAKAQVAALVDSGMAAPQTTGWQATHTYVVRTPGVLRDQPSAAAAVVAKVSPLDLLGIMDVDGVWIRGQLAGASSPDGPIGYLEPATLGDLWNGVVGERITRMIVRRKDLADHTWPVSVKVDVMRKNIHIGFTSDQVVSALDIPERRVRLRTARRSGETWFCPWVIVTIVRNRVTAITEIDWCPHAVAVANDDPLGADRGLVHRRLDRARAGSGAGERRAHAPVRGNGAAPGGGGEQEGTTKVGQPSRRLGRQ
jgi:hypothetical protein